MVISTLFESSFPRIVLAQSQKEVTGTGRNPKEAPAQESRERSQNHGHLKTCPWCLL